jgi:hypothetical protein
VPMGAIGTVRLGKLGRCAAHSCILRHDSQSGCHANPFGTLTAMGAGPRPRWRLMSLASRLWRLGRVSREIVQGHLEQSWQTEGPSGRDSWCPGVPADPRPMSGFDPALFPSRDASFAPATAGAGRFRYDTFNPASSGSVSCAVLNRVNGCKATVSASAAARLPVPP